MLKELRISNLALIDSLEIDFSGGLSVMTGETGAGKSIILQALNLLQGVRASGDIVRRGAERASIEARFTVAGESGIAEMLDEMDLDFDGEVILRRVVRAAGGSRFYLNGSMATAATLSEVASRLFGIASQHEHQRLLSSSFQLSLIDIEGGLEEERGELAALHRRYHEAREKLAELLAARDERERRRELLAFQVEEISAAGLVPGEDAELEQEMTVLKAADSLRRGGREAVDLLDGRVSDDLGRVRTILEKMAVTDSGLASLSESVSELFFLLEEKGRELRTWLDNISDDPARMEEIGARLDLINSLKRKYGPELDDVIRFGDEAARELEEIEESGGRAAALEKEVAELAAALVDAAGRLSAGRAKAADRLAARVEAELAALCLEHARFAVGGIGGDGRGLDDIGPSGWDRPEFLFSANPGEDLRALAKVASGGELSRVMLALKCAMARRDRVETVIFDEVDSGVGGRAADAVGRKISELAGHHQVVCITHLPQIAARAEQHFRVEKEVAGGRTLTRMTMLDEAARRQELARMLDGDSAGATTMAYVDELMARRGGSE